MFKLDYFTQKLIRKKHVNKENLRVFKKNKIPDLYSWQHGKSVGEKIYNKSKYTNK